MSSLTRLIQGFDVWLKDTLTNAVYNDPKGTQLGLYHTTVFMLAYSCLYSPIYPPQSCQPSSFCFSAVTESLKWALSRRYKEQIQSQSWSFPACPGPSVWCLVWKIMVCCYYAFTSRPQGGWDRNGSMELRSVKVRKSNRRTVPDWHMDTQGH